MQAATIAFLFPAILFAGDDLPAQIDRLIDVARVEYGAPGISLAVVKDGRILYAKGSGVASVETAMVVTPDTLFRIASTSKMFTAAAFASLAEAGRVDLDKPVREYAPKLQPCLGETTLHQILSHTAGLRDDAPMDGPHDDAALGNTVMSWGSEVCFAPPGKIFSYSNPGYALAGYVLEQVTGKPFADSIRDLVLLPAGMIRSTFRPLMAMTYPLALGHHPKDSVVRPYPDHAGTWPAGSLFSSANEIARFMIALLEEGRIDGKQALPARAIARMEKPSAKALAIGRGYGYGLQVFEEDGQPVIRHTGGRIGYGSVIHLLPAQHIGVVALTNNTSIANQLVRDVARLIAGTVPISSRGAASHPEPVPLVLRERLRGSYINGATIRVALAERDGGLHLQFAGRWFPVQRLGPDRYGAAGAAQLSDFRIVNGMNGEPEYLVAEMWALRKQQ